MARQFYVTFAVRGVEFGVRLSRMVEMLEPAQWTPARAAPPCVAGVLHARSGDMPLVDLASALGGAPNAVSPPASVVVVLIDLDRGQHAFGFLADQLGDVVELQDIAPAPAFGGHRVECLLGIGKLDERLILLLDVDRILPKADLRRALSLGEVQ